MNIQKTCIQNQFITREGSIIYASPCSCPSYYYQNKTTPDGCPTECHSNTFHNCSATEYVCSNYEVDENGCGIQGCV